MGLRAGCVFHGTQVVIPTKLQSQVLRELHTSSVQMKGLAMATIYQQLCAKLQGMPGSTQSATPAHSSAPMAID